MCIRDRIDSVLNLEPLKETAHPKHPKDGSVELEQVHFSYDGEKEVSTNEEEFYN